MLEKTLAKQC